MKVHQLKLEELFVSHNLSKVGKQKVSAINLATIEYAKTLCNALDNPADLTVVLRKLQEVRHQANQSITFADNDLSYRIIFEVE